MMYGLDEADLNAIVNTIAADKNVKQIILFGSRAMGNFKPGSDIDLALKGEDLSFDTILCISIALENLGLLYKIDMARYNTIQNPDMIDHINRVGKVIFDRARIRPSDQQPV